MYGLYDLTNFATLKGYTLEMTLTDMAWGDFLEWNRCWRDSVSSEIIFYYCRMQTLEEKQNKLKILKSQVEQIENDFQEIGVLTNQADKFTQETRDKMSNIRYITNIKNERLAKYKEAKSSSQKLLGVVGLNKKDTERRLKLAKGKLLDEIEEQFHPKYNQMIQKISELQKEKSKLLSPLENEITTLENEIIALKREINIRAEKNRNKKTENQKSDLIMRYTTLGYKYFPNQTERTSSCAGMPQYAQQYMNCTPREVTVPKSDYFEYSTEEKEKPVDSTGWTSTTKTIIIPEHAEYIPGQSYNYMGQTHYAETKTKIVPESSKEVTIWTRPLPEGFPKKVKYNDFIQVLDMLENKSTQQTRKRKNRKQRKTRKQ